MVEFLKLDGRAVAEAIKSAAPEGLEVRVFLGIHHGGYHEGTRDWIEDSLNWPSLDGYDLHGPETDPLGPWAADFWDRARQAGKTTKAHAGEFDGPDFVRRCLDELGVHRIQHGVRSVEDPKLIERLAADGATLDVCPISNVKLGVVSSYDRHPMRSLLEAGIRCTVSTDDPMIFGNTLFDEYAMLSARGGLTHSELARIAANGFEAALVDESQRASWLVELSEATGRG
jgi:adenosine deaminase